MATNRVEIFRNAEGDLVLHPMPTDRGAALLDALNAGGRAARAIAHAGSGAAVRYMLDTHILIYLMKKKPPQVAERVNALSSEAELCMSFFTFAELLMGAERSTQKTDVLRRLDALTRVVPVYYGVNRAICEHYVLQFTQLRAAGTPPGANDLWIASHALADDCTLVTNNTREFERVAGLRLENWAQSAGSAPMVLDTN